MKSLLSRCTGWRTIGLSIDEQRVALRVVMATPWGTREVARDVRSCDGEPPETILEPMLAPWLRAGRGRQARSPGKAGADRGPWVQVALPESRAFQAVVPVTAANRTSPPQAFFMEAVQATNLRAEERVIDLIRLELNKQPLACLAASPRPVVQGLMETLGNLGTRVALIEPAPAGLFRAGAARKRAPRASRVCLRVFLGQAQAIGVLATSAQPLFWHAFDLPAGDPTAAILATYSTLWMQARHSRITLPIDTVVVHGRPELELTIAPEAFRERTGAALLRCDGPDHEPAAAALGTALANPLAEAVGPDLARGLKPAVPIREIFPWGELALQGALVAGVSMFLHGTAVELDSRHESTRVEAGTFAWLKEQDQAKLEAEEKLLDESRKAVDAFRASRMDWSAQLRTIAADMPDSTVVTSFQGIGEGESVGKAGTVSKNQMVVSFSTPMADDGAMPREINEFITALRAESALKRHFPAIEVAGLRANPAQRDRAAFASYSVVCLPGTDPMGNGPKPAVVSR
jgi:hypothetical protein